MVADLLVFGDQRMSPSSPSLPQSPLKAQKFLRRGESFVYKGDVGGPLAIDMCGGCVFFQEPEWGASHQDFSLAVVAATYDSPEKAAK